MSISDSDVRDYFEKCRLKENVSAALDSLFSLEKLPFNPHNNLVECFLSCAERYFISNSHNPTRGYKRWEVVKSGHLYCSTAPETCVAGLKPIVSLVNVAALNSVLTRLSSLVEHLPEKSAVTLLSPGCFHGSILGRQESQVSLHVDLVYQNTEQELAVTQAADAILCDYDNTAGELRSLAVVDERGVAHSSPGKEELVRLLPGAETIRAEFSILDGGTVLRVNKTFSVLLISKRVMKLICTCAAGPLLTHLHHGVLVGEKSMELYNSLILTSSLIEQDARKKEVVRTLSPKHPTVLASVRTLLTEEQNTSPRLDIFRFFESFLLMLLLDGVDEDADDVIREISLLFQSTSAVFHDVAERYRNFELWAEEQGSEKAPAVLAEIVGLLQGMEPAVSPVHSWSIQSLEHNAFLMEQMTMNADQLENLPAFVGVEKVSCGMASLSFLPPALSQLPLLSEIVGRSVITTIKDGHPYVSSELSTPSTTLPKLEYDIGFYDHAFLKPLIFGVDVSKNLSKVTSSGNIPKVIVLTTYQSHMHIDSTIENALSTISMDYPPNPYNELVRECLTSAHQVWNDSTRDSYIRSALLQKPRLKDAEHQVFGIGTEIQVFGLHHALQQVDLDGLEFVLAVCETVKNNPYITKKDGIRISHIVLPDSDSILTGRMDPMVYSLRCEEYYVMIKEKGTATVDIGLSFLTELLMSHLVEMAGSQVVLGYSVDGDEVVLLNMDQIQGRLREREALQTEIRDCLYNRSQLTFEFLVRSPVGHYVRVTKDIKPIYTDKSTGLDDHFTPSDILNANFAIFGKLYSANFFYDYAPGRTDLDFAVNQLNQRIVRERDRWEVYRAIQLKCMLNEDSTFLAAAVRFAHSHCARIQGAQQLNSTISDLLEIQQSGEGNVDRGTLQTMITDYVAYCRALLKILGVGEFLKTYVELYLARLCVDGMEGVEAPLRTLYIVFSSLAQFHERAFARVIRESTQKYVKAAEDELARSAAAEQFL